MPNPINLNRLMWLALGAGSKGVIGGLVSGFVPGAGITPDIATAFIGFFVAQQGGDRLGTFGEGMLIASIGQIVRQPIEQLFQKFQGNQTKTTQTQTPPAGGGSIVPTTQENYVLARYNLS